MERYRKGAGLGTMSLGAAKALLLGSLLAMAGALTERSMVRDVLVGVAGSMGHGHRISQAAALYTSVHLFSEGDGVAMRTGKFRIHLSGLLSIVGRGKCR